jgi:hypothetical protein
MKNRLTDPSEIRAFDFKGEFRRSAICLLPATIGVDRPILGIFRENGSSAWRKKDRQQRHSAHPSAA